MAADRQSEQMNDLPVSDENYADGPWAPDIVHGLCLIAFVIIAFGLAKLAAVAVTG